MHKAALKTLVRRSAVTFRGPLVFQTDFPVDAFVDINLKEQSVIYETGHHLAGLGALEPKSAESSASANGIRPPIFQPQGEEVTHDCPRRAVAN